MTPREQQAFEVGLMLGAALMAHEQQDDLAELDQRLQKVEHNLRPSPRLRHLAFAGWLRGRRMGHRA